MLCRDIPLGTLPHAGTGFFSGGFKCVVAVALKDRLLIGVPRESGKSLDFLIYTLFESTDMCPRVLQNGRGDRIFLLEKCRKQVQTGDVGVAE